MTTTDNKILWEEKNLTDQQTNLLKNVENDNCDITTETKPKSIKRQWINIGKEKRICQWCNTEFNTNSLTRKFCSMSCAASFGNRNFKKTDEQRKQKSKEVYQKVKKYQENYRKLYKEKYIKLSSEYRKNPLNKERYKKRRKTDINFRLKLILRARFRAALNGNYKSGSAVNDLGCSIDELKKYIESKFTNGMSWNNHGQFGWHVDHIKPLTSFDLTDRKQLLEACHYTNLQPMWWYDNITKGNRKWSGSSRIERSIDSGKNPCAITPEPHMNK